MTPAPSFGMWLFLFTEVILFSGLFILYAVYLQPFPQRIQCRQPQTEYRISARSTP